MRSKLFLLAILLLALAAVSFGSPVSGLVEKEGAQVLQISWEADPAATGYVIYRENLKQDNESVVVLNPGSKIMLADSSFALIEKDTLDNVTKAGIMKNAPVKILPGAKIRLTKEEREFILDTELNAMLKKPVDLPLEADVFGEIVLEKKNKVTFYDNQLLEVGRSDDAALSSFIPLEKNYKQYKYYIKKMLGEDAEPVIMPAMRLMNSHYSFFNAKNFTDREFVQFSWLVEMPSKIAKTEIYLVNGDEKLIFNSENQEYSLLIDNEMYQKLAVNKKISGEYDKFVIKGYSAEGNLLGTAEAKVVDYSNLFVPENSPGEELRLEWYKDKVCMEISAYRIIRQKLENTEELEYSIMQEFPLGLDAVTPVEDEEGNQILKAGTEIILQPGTQLMYVYDGIRRQIQEQLGVFETTQATLAQDTPIKLGKGVYVLSGFNVNIDNGAKFVVGIVNPNQISSVKMEDENYTQYQFMLRDLDDGDNYQVTIETMDANGIPVFASATEQVAPYGYIYDVSTTVILVGVLVFIGTVMFFLRVAKRDPNLYVRPISGISEIDNAMGRATEMGKPVLFVPGLSSIGDVATIAGLTILARIAKKAATFETPIFVPIRDPIVLPVAQEIVKDSYTEVGKPDIYDPNSVRFITTSQFAFVAGVSGIMKREKTATNFYMGMFWAESLILTETGNSTGAIQIAGTDADTQLPFFITTCDYTLIGEELYAASAYLSREPLQLGSLKAQDFLKILFIISMVIGTVLLSMDITWFADLFPMK